MIIALLRNSEKNKFIPVNENWMRLYSSILYKSIDLQVCDELTENVLNIRTNVWALNTKKKNVSQRDKNENFKKFNKNVSIHHFLIETETFAYCIFIESTYILYITSQSFFVTIVWQAYTFRLAHELLFIKQYACDSKSCIFYHVREIIDLMVFQLAPL